MNHESPRGEKMTTATYVLTRMHLPGANYYEPNKRLKQSKQKRQAICVYYVRTT